MYKSSLEILKPVGLQIIDYQRKDKLHVDRWRFGTQEICGQFMQWVFERQLSGGLPRDLLSVDRQPRNENPPDIW